MPRGSSTTSEDATISESHHPVLLQARQVALRRGRQWLTRDLNLSVHAGELIWLQGANGCGKTTLLRALVGLGRLEQGTVSRAPAHMNVLYIGHQLALNGDLNARDALRFVMTLHGQPCTALQIDSALAHLGVRRQAAQALRTLSQGQQRRVALSRLKLDTEARVWVLDEPFDALDHEGIAVVSALMTQHVKTGGSIVLSSHVPLDRVGLSARALHLGAQP